MRVIPARNIAIDHLLMTGLKRSGVTAFDAWASILVVKTDCDVLVDAKVM